MEDVMTFPKSVDEFMEQYKLVDEDHVYSNGTAFVPIFRMKQWFDHLQALPITNADRIRSMPDEELAQVVRNPCDIVDHYPAGWCKERNCGYKCALEWLKQEATDADPV